MLCTPCLAHAAENSVLSSAIPQQPPWNCRVSCLHLRLGACLQVPAGGWLGYLQLHLTLFAVGVATGCFGASFMPLWPFFLTAQIQSWEKGSQPGSLLPTFWRVPDLAVDIIWTKQLRGGCPDSFMQCAMLALVVSGN